MATQTNYVNAQKKLGHEIFMVQRDARRVRDAMLYGEIDQVTGVFRLRDLEAKQAKFKAAQVRCRQGTYGICKRCRNPIEPERLDIIPIADMCSLCARQTHGTSYD